MNSANDRITKAVEYIDKRLSTVDRAPGTWGSPESLELQTLLLLELRTFLLRPRAHKKNPSEARFAYFRFIKSRVADATAELLSAQLQRQGRGAELPKLLGEFRDHVMKTLGPEDAAPVDAPAKPAGEAVTRPSAWFDKANQSSIPLPAPPRIGDAKMVH